ncbi:hypothetical protein GJAV_G00188460 [Gymnothorax javanicus]|nr:hypothetical protein GJAV_G00188460 [Gymnothorax javanicus]
MLQPDVCSRPYRLLVWNARAEHNCRAFARRTCTETKNCLLKILGYRYHLHQRGPLTHWLGSNARPAPRLSPSRPPSFASVAMPSAHSIQPLEEGHHPLW